jgi:hypothetical protein
VAKRALQVLGLTGADSADELDFWRSVKTWDGFFTSDNSSILGDSSITPADSLTETIQSHAEAALQLTRSDSTDDSADHLIWSGGGTLKGESHSKVTYALGPVFGLTSASTSDGSGSETRTSGLSLTVDIQHRCYHIEIDNLDFPTVDRFQAQGDGTGILAPAQQEDETTTGGASLLFFHPAYEPLPPIAELDEPALNGTADLAIQAVGSSRTVSKWTLGT